MTNKHPDLPKPILIDHCYLEAILEEIEDMQRTLMAILKQLKRESTVSALPVPNEPSVTKRKAK